MQLKDLTAAIEEYSRIKQECENSKMSVKPILVFNKEKNIYEVCFLSPEYIKNFMSEKFEIIKTNSEK